MVANPQSLNEFVNFRLQHIKGKERSEAQVFLDKFFRAFGHQGAIEAGATYESAIKKGSRQGKTGFADLVWKPRVLIEMKKGGEDLGKHYRQAFDYWIKTVPNRPSYVMLCNFDEFWIYDFDNQIDEPVDRVTITRLPERASAFGFMGVTQKTPIFENNQVEITQKTARKMGELCQILQQRGRREGTFSALAAQRLVLQCVLAMFAEDRGLLPQDIFIDCIQDCLKGKSSYDVLGGLFSEMNRPGITPAGKYKGVDYFNGGLFATIHPIELTKEELTYLDEAARENWQRVRPAIFGSILEGTANQKNRHARGMHFTSEADIMKIVKPTIIDYWQSKIENANTIAELDSLQIELQNYKIQQWITKDKKNKDVLKLFSMGSNLAKNPHGKPERWIIDFNNMDLEDASDYQLPFEHIKTYVKPERDKNRRKTRRLNWWKYGENAPKMRQAIEPFNHYFAIPEVSKWAIFIPCSVDWLPGNKNKVIASDDYYILGILTSNIHRVWMEAQKSTLKADIAYTHKTCFETFPFPQYDCSDVSNCKGDSRIAPTDIIQKIRHKTIELHQYRTQQMEKKQWGITQLYNEYFHEPASKLYQLHQQLDKLVMQAYNFRSGDDILSKLLELNLELAAKEKRGESIIGVEAPV